jgi:hypothetical protein
MSGPSATPTNPDTAVAYIRLSEWASVLLVELAQARRGSASRRELK